MDWKTALDYCKSENSILLGNVNLQKVDEACNVINETVTGPSWLGIAKEIYISIDRGIIFCQTELLLCEYTK